MFQSRNMNYIFNVEYFEGVNLMENDAFSQKKIKENNREMRQFAFRGPTPTQAWRELPGYREITLYTTYPGLLIGTGNPHALAVDGAFKLGFTFDYVTGFPYLPGSSLKGTLRSAFPSRMGELEQEEKENHIEYIKAIFGEENLDVEALEEAIFDNQDVFLGAYPEVSEMGESLLEMDFITPHKERFKNPNPVSLVKIKPNVKMVFSFLLHGSEAEMQKKEALFKQLLLDGGVGAKTNVGYGRLSERKTQESVSNVVPPQPRQNQGGGNNQGNRPNQGQRAGQENRGGQNAGNRQPVDTNAPKCANAGCNNRVTMNPNSNRYNRLCARCYREQRG